MAANGSGLQWSTVRSIAMAWVLTLPAAALLAGGLYFRSARSSEATGVGQSR
jgi:PiT family inorganic phosphate transporter